MTDRDEQLVKRFLQEQAPGKADKDFTERVLARLPEKQATINTALLNSLWTAGCLLVLAIAWLAWGNWAETVEFCRSSVQMFPLRLSAFAANVSDVLHHWTNGIRATWNRTEWWQFGVILVLLAVMRRQELHRSK